MPGNPEAKLKRIDNIVDWFADLASEFDKALPKIYRYDGQPPGRDRRANAWSNADKCIVMTGAALATLERVLRSHAIERAKPRGRPKAEVVADVVEMNVVERR